MAQQLIDSLSGEFDPSKYHDDYRERVLDLIERKAAGEEIAVQPEAEEPAAAPDLMAALEASLAAVKSDDGGDESAPKARKKTRRRLGKRQEEREAPGQGQELAEELVARPGPLTATDTLFRASAPCSPIPVAAGVPQ